MIHAANPWLAHLKQGGLYGNRHYTLMIFLIWQTIWDLFGVRLTEKPDQMTPGLSLPSSRSDFGFFQNNGT